MGITLHDETEAAALLKCSREMVRKLKRTKRLRFVKVGRLTRFRSDDLAAFIEGATQGAPVAA
jgi:excisionase family DNA binding protein